MPGGGPSKARRVSFRALGVEQIGHVYEGLLDHTAVRATEPVLGIRGTRDKEPEIPLATLMLSGPRREFQTQNYPIDLSPNHNRDTVTVPPHLRTSICRRFKLDPSVLDVGFDDSE